jgi:hypothetical protein
VALVGGYPAERLPHLVHLEMLAWSDGSILDDVHLWHGSILVPMRRPHWIPRTDRSAALGERTIPLAVSNPDPRRYREAEVALGLEGQTYRGFVSRGAAGRLRELLGGESWDARKPHLPRAEAERFRACLSDMGLEARWHGDVLVASDPAGRWRPIQIAPNRHGLYQVGAFGRPVRQGSGFLREWQEVVPLSPDEPLDAETIARVLDTELPLGPAFDRIEAEVGATVLMDALTRAKSDSARERLAILLAYHPDAIAALAALPQLVALLESADVRTRRSAATAIATLGSRAGRARALGVLPKLAAALSARLAREQDESVRDDLEAALGMLGGSSQKGRDPDAEPFALEVREALDFLSREHGFSSPEIEHTNLSTKLTYRNDTTAVVADADWRDGVAEVFLVKLEHGALPVYADTELTHWLPPTLLLHALERSELEPAVANPRDRDATRRFLDDEAAALERCRDVLRGDFARFERALAGLRAAGR